MGTSQISMYSTKQTTWDTIFSWGVAMPNDADWVAAAIKKAREQGIAAPNTVWAQVEDLLRGRFGERPAPAKELERTARSLIEGMVDAPFNLKEAQ